MAGGIYNFSGDNFFWRQFSLDFGIFLMSYKGGSFGYKGNNYGSAEEESLYVDKSSVVHYDGTPKLAEEYEERVMLGFQALSTADKAGYAAKLKNALHGRAWTLCHRKAEISAQKLLDLSEGSGDGQGPQAAVKLLVSTVRKACERVAPLLKNQAFEDFFFERGRRRPGEPIQDFIQRRENEYERMQSLSQGHTKLSLDLQAFFLLRNSGASPQQQKAILGQAGNEYDWDKVVEAMMIQMDGDQNNWQKGGRKGFTGSSASSAKGWAYSVEEETYMDENYDAGDENYDEYQHDVWNAEETYEDDGIYEDLEEFEQSLEVLVVDSMSTEELEVFAMESQKLARSASHYAQKRKMVQRGKTNRGYHPNAISHNRTAVSLDGKLTLNSGQLQDTLAQVKAKTKCHACNQYGHWQGDKECPKGGAKAKGKGVKGRRGGFLQRAGVAAAMIITGVTGALVCDDPMPMTDVFMVDMPGSVQVFANHSNDELIPPGYAVIDTAALLGCAGDGALDQFLQTFGGKDVRIDETRTFRGVNSAAPIISREVQQLSVGLAGRDARVALHRLSNSRVPILFGLPQLRALGAVLNLDGPSVVFSKVCNKPIPLKYSKTGHLMIDISNWNKSAKRKETVIDTKHIEVFPIITADTTQSEKRVLRSKERKRVQQMADDAKAHGKALWKVLRGDQKPKDDIMVKELYCGRGGGAVTLEAKAANIPVGRPRDLILGDNFLNAQQQRAVLEELEKENPFLVVIAFPCDPWSSLSNFKNLDQKEWEQSEALKHLLFIKKVCMSQLRRGRHFLIENPLASQAWKIIMEWLAQVPHHTISMHQCQFELKDLNEDYILKPTRLASSSPMVAAEMAVKCKGDHTHAEVQGRGQGVSASLAEWTPEMGRAILRGAMKQHHFDISLGFPVYDMQDVPEDFHLPADVFVHDRLRRSAAVVFREAEESEFNVWNEVPSLLRSAIIKVHKQYSHSLRGDELVRHLRLGGASETAVKAARLFSCEVCEREARNLPRPVAAAPKYERFGECIAMDVAFVPCLDDRLHAFLVMVDMATHFTVASYLVSGENAGETCKPTSDQARRALLDWCELLGVPQRCQIDQDSCFRGIFKSALDTFGIEDILIARDGHWSHGMVERRVLMLKEMVAKVAPEFHAKGSLLMRVVMTQCAHTINRLANNQGFSPAQCVLGSNTTLPEVITGGRIHPAMQRNDFLMERRLHLQQLCEESFAKASHNSALRRALLSQVRRQPGPFELHSMVMYKRKMAKHQMHHTWHGPARVIGKDIHGYWLIHRGMPILAHANNLRRAVDSEMFENPGAGPMEDEDDNDDDGQVGGHGPKGQRGVLDLTKEIPDNPMESMEDEVAGQSRFGEGLPMSHPSERPEQSFEPPDLPYNPDEEYYPEDLLDPKPLPEDLQMIEDKADGWQVRAGHGLTFLKTNPTNFIVPTPFPEFELRTTWVRDNTGWYLLEDQNRWKTWDNPERPLDVVYEKMITVFNRDHHSGSDHHESEQVKSVFDDEELEERRLKSASRSSRRRKRRKKQKLQDQTLSAEDPQIQQNFEEQAARDERKRKALDDVPISLRNSGAVAEEDPSKLARHDDEHDVGESKHHDDAEVDFMVFLAERLCDHYEKRNKHVELNHRRVYEQLKEFSKEVIDDAMQRGLDKEFQTWDKFEAIEVIPPAQANEIRKNEKDKVISSRCVWTRKETADGKLEVKCRIVGRGFQEQYDENLRRDSPTCSQLLVNLICSIAASRGMRLTAADVRGAFLQGLKIERELYFELPSNTGKAMINGIEPGSLL